MHTHLLLVLLLTIGACNTVSGHTAPVVVKSDRERDELKGPVQHVVTRFIGEKDKYGDVDDRIAHEESYDRAGNLTETKEYTPDFIATRTPERKDANNVIFHSRMGDRTEHYEFDAAGNLVEKEIRFGIKFDGSPDTITLYKYDTAGRVIEEDFAGPDGKIGDVTLYTRDADGNIASEEVGLNGAKPPYPHTDYKYEFDSQRNWVKRTEKRTGFPADTYTYGPTGTLIRTITYN